MSKPLVTPTRYFVRCEFGDGSERQLMLPEPAKPDCLPTPATTLRALYLDEVINGIHNQVLAWKPPRTR